MISLHGPFPNEAWDGSNGLPEQLNTADVNDGGSKRRPETNRAQKRTDDREWRTVGVHTCRPWEIAGWCRICSLVLLCVLSVTDVREKANASLPALSRAGLG